jgi:2-keto-4-pentenoate hydratase
VALTAIQVAEAAKNLYQAEMDRAPIAPLVEGYPGLSVEDAYQIQVSLIELKKAQGAKVVGKKTGLTSKAMQQMLGVNEPDFGHLLDTMMVKDHQPISVKELIQPKVEPEIAFLLARDLEGPGISAQDVLDATRAVTPSLEIIDSRIRDWRIRLADTVADNASSGRVALGDAWVSPQEIDLRLTGMVLEKNGEVVSTGAGAAVLGHPAAAVAWLANKLATFGLKLLANEVILPGALCGAVGVAAGDEVTATFDRLGSVSARFV